jgi:very-short-patch-repair endonuclease
MRIKILNGVQNDRDELMLVDHDSCLENSFPSPLGSRAMPWTQIRDQGHALVPGRGRGEGWKTRIARKLRKHQTNAENYLWYFLRNRRLSGYKFKRQYPIKSYVVDFICLEMGIIIELDGSQHLLQVNRDTARDYSLLNLGYTILRFWNDQIFRDTKMVLTTIKTTLEASEFSPSKPRDEREQ